MYYTEYNQILYQQNSRYIYQFCTSTKHTLRRFVVCLPFSVYYCAISWDKFHTCVLSYNVNTENKTVFTKSWNEFIGGRTFYQKNAVLKFVIWVRCDKQFNMWLRKRLKDKNLGHQSSEIIMERITQRFIGLLCLITVEPVEFIYCLMFTISNIVRDNLFVEKGTNIWHHQKGIWMINVLMYSLVCSWRFQIF